MVTHVVNKGAVQKSVQVEVVFQYRTTGGADAKPLWFDIDGCGDSDYTTPVGYNDATADWTSTVSGRMIGMSGHLHDVDITNSAPCTNHCPSLGNGWAVSAEVLGGNPSDYYGPTPPNNTPPASLTGATMCRSEALYGTPWGGTRYRGHLDTMTQCGISSSLLPGIRRRRGRRPVSSRRRATRSARARRSGSTASTRTTTRIRRST